MSAGSGIMFTMEEIESSSTGLAEVLEAQIEREEQLENQDLLVVLEFVAVEGLVENPDLLVVLCSCAVEGLLRWPDLLSVLVSLSPPCVLWGLPEGLLCWLVTLDGGSSFLGVGLPSAPTLKGGYPTGGGTGAPAGTPAMGRTMIPTPGPAHQIGNSVG